MRSQELTFWRCVAGWYVERRAAIQRGRGVAERELDASQVVHVTGQRAGLVLCARAEDRREPNVRQLAPRNAT